MVVCGAMIIRQLEFYGPCLPMWTPVELLYFRYASSLYPQSPAHRKIPSVMEITFQVLIFMLTLYKQFVAVLNGWQRTPVVSIVMRDGAVVFATMSGKIVAITGCTNPNPEKSVLLSGTIVNTLSQNMLCHVGIPYVVTSF